MISRANVTRVVRLFLPAVLPVLVSACGSGRTISGISSTPPPAAGTLAQIQQQIFTPYCAGCHCPGGYGPMPLTDTATSSANLVGVDPTNTTAREAGQKRVVAGDPARSFLLNKLTGQMEFGEGDVMPQNANPLSADQIALIRKWIQAGAPSGLPGNSPAP